MRETQPYADLLFFVENLRIKSMFGGHGVYCGALMFGLINDGVLYFKVDDTTRPAYQSSGSAPFSYPATDKRTGQSKTMVMNGYWRVPEVIIDDADRLTDWTNQAIAVSRKAPAKKKSAASISDKEQAFNGLGVTSQKYMAEIGIKTVADLRREGAIISYKTLKDRYPKRVSLNLLWGLYALINDLDAKAIDEETKSHLKSLL
jgi:DNA transformation protein and related proteins